MHTLWAAHERSSSGMIRWEHARPCRLRGAWIDEAICQWCGETVAREIEYNPRHADSVQEAVAICHLKVEQHLIDGCSRGRDDG